MKKLDIWAVAAAIMINQKSPIKHFDNLTNEIIATKLTTLAEKGITPQNTVRRLIAEKKHLFTRVGKGLYQLDIKKALKESAVQLAIDELRSLTKHNNDLEKMQDLIIKLQKENQSLKKQLSNIQAILNNQKV